MKIITLYSFIFLSLTILVVTKIDQNQSEVNRNQPQSIIVAQYVKYFFPKVCYQKYFAKGRYNAPKNCYLTISSRFLSLLNTIAVFFIRIPQITKIINKKNVNGLSYFGNNLQFIMPMMTFGYGIYANLPTSIYVENLFISIQSFIVLSLFFVYTQKNYESQKNTMKAEFLTSLIISFVFVCQLVPNYMQDISIWLQLIIFILGRGSQLVTNFKNKSTGNLAMLTVIITVIANSIRMFSIIMQAPGNIAYLLNYLIPFFVNGYILFQFYLYRKQTPSSQTLNLKQQ